MPQSTQLQTSSRACRPILALSVVFAIFSIPLMQENGSVPAAEPSVKKAGEKAGEKTGAKKRPAVARRPVATSAVSSVLLFEKHVLPIFKSRCLRCHRGKSRKGDLDLTSFANVMKGGESGNVIEPGKTDESLLYEMIHDGTMPPDKKNLITKAEIATIHRWIAGGAKSAAAQLVARFSQHDIIPLMNLRCTVCHGLRVKKAGLDLRSKASMLRGGKSGPAMVPGSAKKSLILKRIHAAEMPPRKLLVRFGVRPMQFGEIEKLTKWIADGAPEKQIEPDIATRQPDPLVSDKDRRFWAFQSPQRPRVPSVRNSQLVRNPIDAFLLRKLASKGLSYSASADRTTLIRRVAFDLTGLPPTWKEVEQFRADSSPRAYRAMVERYLASPAYGERWGQYWLDLAGYSDSEGKRSADVVRQHAWRYRDYIIRAFNADKPYNRFLLEQLAGDELRPYDLRKPLSPEVYDNLVATGFLRMAPDGTGSDIVNTAVERMEVVSDEINVLGSTVLALTMKCAQCHSHKYDPIPQRDYYRLVAVFKGAYDLHDWLKSSSVSGQTESKTRGRLINFESNGEGKTWNAKKKEITRKIAAVHAELKVLRKRLTAKRVAARIAKLPAKFRDDVRKMLAVPRAKRTARQKRLATKFGKRLKITDAQLRRLDRNYRQVAVKSAKTVKRLKSGLPGHPAIRGLWDRGVPSPTYLFRRGETTKPGTLVGPGVPSVLTDGKTPFDVKPPWPGAKKTGRRLAFAKWLTQPAHPLTARVMVNRIWSHHFGRGIVKSLGNFGNTGSRPTHPELLDWLAIEFVNPTIRVRQQTEKPWSVKHIHRLILTSNAYRQVSQTSDKLLDVDPENAFVSRMPLKRMDAEVVRDSILAVCGELDATRFGKPDPVVVRADGLVTSKRGKNGWRRSIYVLHRRKEMPTILENFDLPQMIPNCIERPNSTVASQALHLMNNGMIRDLAARFAKRVQKEVGSDPERQVERVYQLVLSHMPNREEKALAVGTLKQLAAAWERQLKSTKKPSDRKTAETRALTNFCHTMINSAAFLYID